MRNKTILIFGDDPHLSGKIKCALSNRALDVFWCRGFERMREAVRKEKSDVVVLDLATNELQGAELIREARSRNPDVSVLLMASDEDISRNPHLLMFGGYEYIRKPVREDMICAAIEQKLNQQHLYRVCSTVSVSREIDETLATLLETLIEEVGANHAAFLLNEGSSEFLAVRAVQGLPAELVGKQCRVDESDVLSLVLVHNEPIVLHEGFIRLPYLEDSISRAISSSICAPVKVAEKTLGLLSVNRMTTGSPFCQSDLRLVEIVALQAAVAVENARVHQLGIERQKLQQEMVLARSIQQNLLPKISDNHEQLEVGLKFLPAHCIGGDFYEIRPLAENRYALAIGDVAGKGVPGAMMMMRTLSSLRLTSLPDSDPARVLAELNNTLFENSSFGLYATVIYAVLDLSKKTFSFANAGHPPPLFRRTRSRKVDSLDSNVGIPLGILKDTLYTTAVLTVEPGDVFFIYTDGLIEARDGGNREFSSARIKKLVENESGGAVNCTNRIYDDIVRFSAGRPQHDDLTFFAVAIKNN